MPIHLLSYVIPDIMVAMPLSRLADEPGIEDETCPGGLPEDQWHRLLDLADQARLVRSTGETDLLASFYQKYDLICAEHIHPLARRVYAPLIARIAAGPLTIAQVGQSLDGRIATESGRSHYINGEGGIDHLHRLRALADAVVVGANTVVLDDPRLTTRRVAGPSPVRVVIDPTGRVPTSSRAFDKNGPALWLRAAHATSMRREAEGGPMVIPIRSENGFLPPRRIMRALHKRELLTVLIEGGGRTVSAFLKERQLHRLHVIVAPILIGPGRTAFDWPAIDRLDAAFRFSMTTNLLGDDVLFDCVLDGACRG